MTATYIAASKTSATRRWLLATTALAIGPLAGALPATPVIAADFTWVGTTNNYNTASNWNPTTNAPPNTSTENAFFNATGGDTVNVGANNFAPNSWSISGAQSYNFNGTGTVTFTTGITNTADTAAQETIKPVVAGTNITVTQNGLSRLRMMNANTYTGSTSILQGGIVVGDSAGLGTSTLTIADGAGFGPATGADNLDVANDVVLTSGAALIDTHGMTFTMSGDISGDGGINKDNSTYVGGNGTGTLILSGQNTFTGDITIAKGELDATVSNTDGSGSLGATTGDVLVKGSGILALVPLGAQDNQKDDVRVQGTGTIIGTGTLTADTYTNISTGASTAPIYATIAVVAAGGTATNNLTNSLYDGVNVSNATSGGIDVTTKAAGDIDNTSGDGIHAAETGAAGNVGVTTMTLFGDVTGSADGIDTSGTTGAQTITLRGSTVTGGTGAGVNATSTGGDITVNLYDVTLNDPSSGTSTVTSTSGAAASINSGGGAVTIQGGSGTMVGATDGDNVVSGGGAILIQNLDRVEGQAGDGIDANSSAATGGTITVSAVDAILGTGGNGIIADSTGTAGAGGNISIQGSGTGYTDPSGPTLYTDIVGTSGDGIHADASGTTAGGNITIGTTALNGVITGSDDGIDATTNGGNAATHNVGTITIAVGSDVTGQGTTGSMGANGRGIIATTDFGDITINLGEGGQAMTVTSETWLGVVALSDGAGTSGSVTIGQVATGTLYGSVSAYKDGVYVRTVDNTITVQNLASVLAGQGVGIGASGDGMDLQSASLTSAGGDITVSNVNTILGNGGQGIVADASGVGTGGNISVQGSGMVATVDSVGIQGSRDGIHATSSNGGDIHIGDTTLNGVIQGGDDGLDLATSGGSATDHIASNAGTITVTLGSDVTGLGTDNFATGHGIKATTDFGDIAINLGAGTGAMTVSGELGDGIHATSTGAVTSGAITISQATGTAQANVIGADDGISAGTIDGAVTIDNLLMVVGKDGDGVTAVTADLTSAGGAISVTDTGTIVGIGGSGIVADSSSAAAGGAITITGNGTDLTGYTDDMGTIPTGDDVTYTGIVGTNGDGVNADSSGGTGAGGAIIVSDNGPILGSGRGVFADSSSASASGGNITINGNSSITGSGGDGIYADASATAANGTTINGGDIHIGNTTANGAIAGSSDGLDLTTNGAGTVTVVTKGDGLGDITGTNGEGIVSAAAAGATDITIAGGASDGDDVLGGLTGMTLTSTSGTITVSLGQNSTVTGTAGNGVDASTTLAGGTITLDSTATAPVSYGAVSGGLDGVHFVTVGQAITVQDLVSVAGGVGLTSGDGLDLSSASTTTAGGLITVSNVDSIYGDGGSGILANSSSTFGNGGNISIQGSGLTPVTGAGIEGTSGDGVNANASGLVNGGNINIGGTTANGDIKGSDDGIDATTNGTGTITIVTGGDVTGGDTGTDLSADQNGIVVASAAVNAVTVSSGDTVSGGTGIRQKSGTLTVTNGGTVAGGTDSAEAAIYVEGGTGTNTFNNNEGAFGIGGLASAANTILTLNNNVDGMNPLLRGTWRLNTGGDTSLLGAATIQNDGDFYSWRTTPVGDTTTYLRDTTLLDNVVFNNGQTGNLFVDAGAATSETFSLDATGGFTNDGAIWLRQDPAYVQPNTSTAFHPDSLIVNGNFEGNSTSPTTGVIYVDIDLGKDNAGSEQLSDQLVVNGQFTGASYVNFAPNNILFGLQTNPIVVIDKTGDTNAGDETVNSNAASVLVDPSHVITYTFGQDASGDWVVKSTADLSFIGGLASSLSTTQAILGTIVNRPAPPFAQFAQDADKNECGVGVWMRGTGGSAKASTDSEGFTSSGGSLGSNSASVKVNYGGAQFAVDYGCYNINGKGINLTGGLSAGFNTGSTTQDGLTGSGFPLQTDVDFDSRFIAGYAVLSKGGFSASLQGRFDATDFSIDSTAGNLSNYDVDGDRWTLAGTLQYRFDLTKGYTLTPQVGLSVSNTKTSNIMFPGSSFELQLEDTKSIVGYAGATLQKLYILPGETSAIAPFLSAIVYNDFGDNPTSVFTDRSTGASQYVVSDNLGTFYEIGLGTSYFHILDGQLGPAKEFSASIRADVKFSDQLLAGGLTAQMRLQF